MPDIFEPERYAAQHGEEHAQGQDPAFARLRWVETEDDVPSVFPVATIFRVNSNPPRLFLVDPSGKYELCWQCGERSPQILIGGGGSALSTSADRFWGPGLTGANTTAFQGSVLCADALTARNLRVILDTAPGAGKSWTVTVMKNEVETAITLTISNSEVAGVDNTNEVAFTAGDLVTIRFRPNNTPAVGTIPHYSLEIVGSSNSMHGFASTGSSTSTESVYTAPFRIATSNATEPARQSLVPINATITRLRVELSGAPGAGASYTFQLRKNGSDVGDPVVISGASATGGSIDLAVAIVPGDLLALHSSTTGGPSLRSWCFTLLYEPTTDGESILSGGTTSGPSTGTRQNHLQGGLAVWSTSTSNQRQASGPRSWTLKRLRVKLTTAPGAGNSWNFQAMGGTAGISGLNNALTIAGTDTEGVDASNEDEISDLDLLQLRSISSGTPTTPGNHSWAAIQFVEPANVSPHSHSHGGLQSVLPDDHHKVPPTYVSFGSEPEAGVLNGQALVFAAWVEVLQI